MNKTTLPEERRSALKKGLTGPTLLEMSGYQCADLPRKSLSRYEWRRHSAHGVRDCVPNFHRF